MLLGKGGVRVMVTGRVSGGGGNGKGGGVHARRERKRKSENEQEFLLNGSHRLFLLPYERRRILFFF